MEALAKQAKKHYNKSVCGAAGPAHTMQPNVFRERELKQMSTLGKKTVEDLNVKGRNVLVRCDFNVPMKDGVITNDNRIVAALPTIKKLIDHDGCAIAVGTTSVRTLESLYHIGVTLAENPYATEEELRVKQWQPYEKYDQIPPVVALQKILGYLDRNGLETLHTSTQIIIAPGYNYKIVKAMVTNFHQPQSTLLLLVSAFVKGNWRTIYDYAMAHDFRFLSYGDSSLLIP